MLREIVIALMFFASSEAKFDGNVHHKIKGLYERIHAHGKPASAEKAAQRKLGRNANGVSYLVEERFLSSMTESSMCSNPSSGHRHGAEAMALAFDENNPQVCINDYGSSMMMIGCENHGSEVGYLETEYYYYTQPDCQGEGVYYVSDYGADKTACDYTSTNVTTDYFSQMSCNRRWPFKDRSGVLRSFFDSPDKCINNDAFTFEHYGDTGKCSSEGFILDSCKKNMVDVTFYENLDCTGMTEHIEDKMEPNAYDTCHLEHDDHEDDQDWTQPDPHMNYLDYTSHKCSNNHMYLRA